MSGFAFDPDRVAEAEAGGWRAYYQRDWVGLLRWILRLSRDQFHMPPPAAVVAGYYTVQASRCWATPDTDPERTRYFLARFYGQARAHSGLSIEPWRAAELELAYWRAHRDRRAGAPHEEYIRTLTPLHAELFGITEQQAAESAELRAQACELAIHITEGRVRDPDAAWTDLTEKLRGCYRSIVHATRSAAATA